MASKSSSVGTFQAKKKGKNSETMQKQQQLWNPWHSSLSSFASFIQLATALLSILTAATSEPHQQQLQQQQPYQHICSKLLGGGQQQQPGSVRLQSATYVRETPERQHPDAFQLYLIEDGQVYGAHFYRDTAQRNGSLEEEEEEEKDSDSSGGSSSLRLVLDLESTVWWSKFMLNSSLINTQLSSSSTLLSLYAFNSETPYSGNKPPGYHLLIRRVAESGVEEDDLLVNQVTGKVLTTSLNGQPPNSSSSSKQHLRYSLALDPFNQGYALSVDIGGDYVLYPFHYQIKGEEGEDSEEGSTTLLDTGNATLLQIGSNEQHLALFYLELSRENRSEVTFVPRSLRTANSTENRPLPLLHSLPIGFVSSLREADEKKEKKKKNEKDDNEEEEEEEKEEKAVQSSLYLFDGAVGCLSIIDSPPDRATLLAHHRSASNFTRPLAVVPFERALDCRFVLSPQQLDQLAHQAQMVGEKRCSEVLWEGKELQTVSSTIDFLSQSEAEEEEEADFRSPVTPKTQRKPRWSLKRTAFYAWNVFAIVGALFLVAFTAALYVTSYRQRQQMVEFKCRLFQELKKVMHFGGKGGKDEFSVTTTTTTTS